MADDDVQKVLREIVAATAPIAEKWAGLREASKRNRDDWEDFFFYKGNGRWAVGAQDDLAALRVESLGNRVAVFDAAEKLLRERSWDTDYDEPDRASCDVTTSLDYCGNARTFVISSRWRTT